MNWVEKTLFNIFLIIGFLLLFLAVSDVVLTTGLKEVIPKTFFNTTSPLEISSV